MTAQRQEQSVENPPLQIKGRRTLSQRTLVIITVILIAIVIATLWILSNLGIIPGVWGTIASSVVTILGAIFAFFQIMHLFVPEHKNESSQSRSEQALVPSIHTIPPIIVQLPPTHQPASSSSFEKSTHRGILGLPPPAHPRTIQQREHIVRDVCAKLTQADITAVALTGIGGAGKSILAALIYRYVEEQRHAHIGHFQAETLWFTIDPAVTFADLAGNLFEALDSPLPDLGNLAPLNQAVLLFNALKDTDKPRLVILDQFENLLDWDTGHALTDRPGVGEWLDIINSQPCTCRILLTSRPRPVGTREYPPTYLQEYPVGGLEMNEGIALLQSRGAHGTETELQSAVSRCAGHAFSLTLLATLMRDHHLDLPTLFKNSALWTGDIATNLLDQIFTQKLNDAQRELLLAFSVYREPIQLEAASAITTGLSNTQILPAMKALVTQHLLEATGEGRYQLHAIIADYAKGRFGGNNGQTNEEALRTAHAKAAQYYFERAITTCPPGENRRKVSDIHDLIEAVWQYLQAEEWQEAYNLLDQEAIFDSLHSWRSYDILQELCELLLPLDRWHASPLQEARIYSILGHTYRVLGKNESAEKYLQMALARYRELDVRREEARALQDLARIYSDMGKIKQAGEYYQEALAICKEVGDVAGEGDAINSLGWVYYVLGQVENARQYCEEALSIYERMQIDEGESSAHNNLGSVYSVFNNLGRVYRTLGEKAKAQACYERALKITREAGDPLGEGLTLHNVGKLYRNLRQYEQALICLEQALRIRRQLGYLKGEGSSLEVMGRIYLDLKEVDKAQERLEEALRISQVIGDSRSEASCLDFLGVAYSLLGRKVQAIECFRRALAIKKSVEDPLGESRILYYIGQVYFEQRQFDVSLASFLLDKKFLDEVHHPYREEVQKWIEKIRNELGDEQFSALMATVEPQAQHIIDQALSSGIDE